MRQRVLEEVRSKLEYRDQSTKGRKLKNLFGLSLEGPLQVPGIIPNPKESRNGRDSMRYHALGCNSKIWRSYADGLLNITSNDRDGSNRSYDDNDCGNHNDDTAHGNYNGRDDENQNENENGVDVINDDNNNDDNYCIDNYDHNEANNKKTRKKNSFGGRNFISSTYDSTHARNMRPLDSVKRTTLSHFTATATLRTANFLNPSKSYERRKSSSSLWTGTQSTTGETAGSQVAGRRRAGSISSLMNMRYHRVDILSSCAAGKYPIIIPDNPLKKAKTFSSNDRVCPEMKLRQNDISNDNSNKRNSTAVRKISSLKIELPDNMKSSTSIIRPTTRKSKRCLKTSKKEIDLNQSEEKNTVVTIEKTFIEEEIDCNLNELIRVSLKIIVTPSQLSILITCKPQKAVLNGQNLHQICTRVPKEEELISTGLLSSKNLLTHKTRLLRQQMSSSNKILRKNSEQCPASKINDIVSIKNKIKNKNTNLDDGEHMINVNNFQIRSYSRAKNKDFIAADKSIQSSTVSLIPKTCQIFKNCNMSSDKKKQIPKILNNSKYSNRNELLGGMKNGPLKSDTDK